MLLKVKKCTKRGENIRTVLTSLKKNAYEYKYKLCLLPLFDDKPTVILQIVVAKSCPTLWDPMDCNPPGSSVHGISQARILEWVAISFSKGSSTQGLNLSLLLGRQIIACEKVGTTIQADYQILKN